MSDLPSKKDSSAGAGEQTSIAITDNITPVHEKSPSPNEFTGKLSSDTSCDEILDLSLQDSHNHWTLDHDFANDSVIKLNEDISAEPKNSHSTPAPNPIVNLDKSDNPLPDALSTMDYTNPLPPSPDQTIDLDRPDLELAQKIGLAINIDEKFDILIKLFLDMKSSLKNGDFLTTIESKISNATSGMRSQIDSTNRELNSVKSTLNDGSIVKHADLKSHFELYNQKLPQRIKCETETLFNTKMKNMEQNLARKVHSEVDSLRKDFHKKTNITATEVDNNEKQISHLSTKVTNLSKQIENIDLSIKQIKEVIDEQGLQRAGKHLSVLDEDIKTIRSNLEELKQSSTGFQNTATASSETKLIQTRLEITSQSTANNHQQIQNLHKKLENLDNRTRKRNIIIDCLPESAHENLRWEIEQLYSAIAPEFQIDWLDAVYRIGALRNDNTPRRVFTSITSQYGKDHILANSYKLARENGYNGAVRLYLNDDFTDETKRRRNDIHKYVEYMKEKNQQVEKKGDSVLLNGNLYSHDELEALPKGQRLSDSRTIYKNGIVSFQSEHSPLSNLYPCRIKYKGIVYNSTEQAYQHQNAIAQNDSVKATRILKENSPYEIMSIARELKVTPEWRNKQQDVMLEIIKAKMEQVKPFAEALKATTTHHIVENSRNSFWAAGCTYNSDLIFRRNYPGKNIMGKLLEHVRSNF